MEIYGKEPDKDHDVTCERIRTTLSKILDVEGAREVLGERGER